MCKAMEIRKSVKKADGGKVLAGRASQGDIVS